MILIYFNLCSIYQGITAGCKDIYYYNIDCQWIDITDLNPGKVVDLLYFVLSSEFISP